jgi:hypothetical protein
MAEVNFYQTTRRYNPEDSHLRLLNNLASEISGSQGGKYEDCCRLGCCTVMSVIIFTTFQKQGG